MTENIDLAFHNEIQKLKHMVSAGFQKYQWTESGSGDAAEGGTSRRLFSTDMLALLHRLSQFFWWSVSRASISRCVSLQIA